MAAGALTSLGASRSGLNESAICLYLGLSILKQVQVRTSLSEVVEPEKLSSLRRQPVHQSVVASGQALATQLVAAITTDGLPRQFGFNF